jgi:hypothetical protein
VAASNIELAPPPPPLRDPSPYKSDEPKPACPSYLDISILPAKGPPPLMVLRGKEELKIILHSKLRRYSKIKIGKCIISL